MRETTTLYKIAEQSPGCLRAASTSNRLQASRAFEVKPRWNLTSRSISTRTPGKMKRKQPPSKVQPAAKKARPEVPEYHLTPSLKDESGEIIWPAPKEQMQRARETILEWLVPCPHNIAFYC